MLLPKKTVVNILLAGCIIATANIVSAATDKPNILVVWGDDIGQSNISYYTHGMMGYTTPNIDRIAEEGMAFTDYYGEQSCTAGHASFIMGQSVFRTGLSKVGRLDTAFIEAKANGWTVVDMKQEWKVIYP